MLFRSDIAGRRSGRSREEGNLDEVKRGVFVEAARKEFAAKVKALERRVLRDIYRDALGLPPVEEELGWRTAFRGPGAIE